MLPVSSVAVQTTEVWSSSIGVNANETFSEDRKMLLLAVTSVLSEPMGAMSTAWTFKRKGTSTKPNLSFRTPRKVLSFKICICSIGMHRMMVLANRSHTLC